VNLAECAGEEMWPWFLAGAWFIQMGVHEGAHAEAAFRCGDDTAALLGKRTIIPIAHIEFTNPFALLVTVALPILTAFGGYGVAMGMAWVPVNPLRFRHMYRDHALVALAGPAANLALSAFCLAVHAFVMPFVPADNSAFIGIESLLASVYLTSLAYGLFNLVPVPPLDGSMFVYWLAPPLRFAIDRMRPWGLLVVYLLFQVDAVAIGFFLAVGRLASLFA